MSRSSDAAIVASVRSELRKLNKKILAQSKLNCICGNVRSHTRECKGQQRMKYLALRQEAFRHGKRSRNVCIYSGCWNVVKPVLIYKQYCPVHVPKNARGTCE